MLFGTPEACVDGIALQRALPHKGMLLLAFLALQSPRSVSTSVIAEAVFPDSQAENTHAVIKKTVQQVRRALGAEAYRLSAPAPRMLALDLEGAACDWAIFHAMRRENRPESLRHAVAVHTRPFLESESYAWVGAEQTRCLQLRQEALETLFRQAMQTLDFAAAAQCLSEQLAFESPFVTVKEALWRELYLSLLQRQEFGLLHHHYMQLKAFFERTAGRLPESETQALYHKIPKSALIQILQAKERKKKSVLPDSARLPSFPFALLGRDVQKRELKAAFPHSRLWTVIGPGGVGKTRFTVEAGREIAGDLQAEVGFIDLIPASQETVLRTVAATLGIKESADVPLYAALREYLSPKRVLLILDNCEQVIEAVAALSADLRRDCPNLFLLCTSRETLRVDGERVFALQPLSVPSLAIPAGSSTAPTALQGYLESDAVRLFCERASAVRPDFQWTAQNALQIVELCRLTDGLPLGIEMVASQVSAAPLERIAANLADCILHLKHHKRGIPARHQTLLAALGWSYSILSEPEQRLLRRLAVFSGGWTLEAAERICSDESLPAEEISLLLSDLASKSLLIITVAHGDALRFSFLETIRVYAEEQLRLASERDSFRTRHLDYFVALAEEADAQLSGKDQKAALERLDAEVENLRQALRFSLEREILSGLRLGYGLGRYWEIRGLFTEGEMWISALLAQTEATDRTIPRARVLDLAGWFRHILGDCEKADALLKESLAIFQEQGDRRDASVTLIKLGFAAKNRDELARARACFEESLALRRELGDPRLMAIALLNLGQVISNLSEFTLARSLYEEALALFEEVGDLRFQANCLTTLGDLAYTQSDLPRARSLYAAGLTVFRELGDRYLIRYPLHDLGVIAFHMEDFAQAFAFFAECLELSREIQVPLYTMNCLEGLADIAAKQQQWDRAARLWGAADRERSIRQTVLDAQAQALHKRLTAAAVQALGQEDYTQAYKAGGALSEEEAYALALRPAALL
ncbi:MAG: hypothetical protein JWN14_4489 [Chthonomonadales bacterium]|nr:hypothetical protein [Chthonomonadales bacterium]